MESRIERIERERGREGDGESYRTYREREGERTRSGQVGFR